MGLINKNKFGFELLHADRQSKARTAILTTPHGVVQTPSFVVVATEGKIKCLDVKEAKLAKTQLIIANAYHLWRKLGKSLDSFPGLHKAFGWEIPIMTDSGGYQIFSFGARQQYRVGKVGTPKSQSPTNTSCKTKAGNMQIKSITDRGVYFLDQGKEIFLDPKISIQIQQQLGADIIFAFDECTSLEHSYQYVKESLQRTHKWAKESIIAHSRDDQMLYGIVQGSIFKDLRERSAQIIGAMPFAGFGIGGSFGEGMMGEMLNWVIPKLPEEKPKHLLGIGKIEDIFIGISCGIDTFDCVIPTREGRHGEIWTIKGRIDILKGIFKYDDSILVKECSCPVCTKNITKSKLHQLFKQKDKLAPRLATVHNVYFFNNLFADIREAIKQRKFNLLKKEILRNIKHAGRKK